ncbi:MAG: DRTGG domain-containing protein [Nitrospiraceae bacterium]|nr:DRTGG domain-containing protein [Nitrospiraceae bacterium]MDA8325163.1 DRTGG domain-containing protein [Nitrospiraceae bacterium]
MTIYELIGKLELSLKNKGCTDTPITGCYASDMLSDVLANGKEGNLWITRQTHPNIAAVAAIKGLSGIIVTGNKDIDPETLEKAESEGIVILSTGLQTCETAGIVYNLFLTDKGGGKA